MSKHFLERLKERYGIDLPKTWLKEEWQQTILEIFNKSN